VGFAGNEVERARARAAYQRARVDATQRAYVVEIRAEGFAFREYDLGDRRLSLDVGRGFTLPDGPMLAVSDRESALDFELEPEAADGVVRERAAGRLLLRLMFRPHLSDVTGEACSSAGGVLRARIDVLALDLLRRDGVVVARAETADFAEAASTASPVTEPVVTVQRPSADLGEVRDDLAAAVVATGPLLLPCYEKALVARVGLRGTLVVSLWLAPEGKKTDPPRMEVSSVSDEALRACVLTRLGRAKLPRPAAPLRLSVPVVFGSRSDAGR
jgi:hypothetical protein